MTDKIYIKCPFCGGILSEVRSNGKEAWRHCYSCHFEFSETNTAHWKKVIDSSSPDHVTFKQVCSNCGAEAPLNDWFLYDLTDYCPNCRLKMVYKGNE